MGIFPDGGVRSSGKRPRRPKPSETLRSERVRTQAKRRLRAERRESKGTKKIIRWTRQLAEEMLVDSTAKARAQAIRGLRSWGVNPALRERLLAMLGGTGTRSILASDMDARVEAGSSFVAWLLEILSAHPQRYFYHATFIDDRLRTKDRETLVDLVRVARPVRAILADNGILHWLGTIEILPFVNWERGRGRDLAPHVHVVFSSDEPIDVAPLRCGLPLPGACRA
jgi:hypothetical protein